MKILTLTIPESLDIDEREAALLLAAKLYEQGKLSLGQAATVAGYTKRTFMELLGDYNVPLLDLNAQELEKDVQNARCCHR